jgi:tRNA pseudouridine55 synthase
VSAALSGVLVVDKPAGPTSHDVVDGVRRALREKRVGHTGTLDPFATGVLPLCIGKATRLARFLTATEKVYSATIRLAFATTTDDLLGEPLGEASGTRVDEAAVRAACALLVGELWQVPPAFSAKRVAGRRMYEIAREGEMPPRDASRVVVHALDVQDVRADAVDVEVRCSSGTYIRAIARDLGDVLGVGGHLTALRRTRAGAFGLEHCVAYPSLADAAARLLSPADALADMPSVVVGPEGLLAVLQGRVLGRRHVLSGFPDAPPERMRVLDEQGRLLALAVPRGFGTPGPGLSSEPGLHADVVVAD